MLWLSCFLVEAPSFCCFVAPAPPPGRLHCLFFLCFVRVLWLSCFLVEAPSFCCFVAPRLPPPPPPRDPSSLPRPPSPRPPPRPPFSSFFLPCWSRCFPFPTLPSCPALACFFHCLLPGALLLACFLFYPARFLSPFLLSRPAPPGPAPPPLLLMLRSRACFFSVFALWLSCCLVEAPSFCCFVAPAASDLLSAILFFVLVFAA